MGNIAERVHASLRPVLSPELELNVRIASDPSLDAWHGMAKFAQTDELAAVSVTQAEYQEWGPERIKKWWGGNWNKAS